MKKADYKDKNVWGECANDFRTVLTEEPDLSLVEFLRDNPKRGASIASGFVMDCGLTGLP